MNYKIAEFLRRIPQSNQDAKSIADLAEGLNVDVLHGYLLLLQTIGVVQLDDKLHVRAASQTAKYMLESLASYVEADLQLVEDWQTRGVFRMDNDNPLQNGATFLHIVETQRISKLQSPKPSRMEKVAQIIIKRTNPETQHAEILMQYDKNAGQYQFIGGRKKDHETIESTAIRELEEELSDDLHYQQNYDLKEIAAKLSPAAILSPTFGALTKYQFWFYQMTGIKHDLTLQPEDRWCAVPDILNGYVTNDDGTRVSFGSSDVYHLLNQHIEGGLVNLPDSFL